MARVGVYDPEERVSEELASYISYHEVSRFHSLDEAIAAGRDLTVDLVVTTTEDDACFQLLEEYRNFHGSPHKPLVLILITEDASGWSHERKKEVTSALRAAGAVEALLLDPNDLTVNIMVLNMFIMAVLLRYWLTSGYPMFFPYPDPEKSPLQGTALSRLASWAGGWEMLKTASTVWYEIRNDHENIERILRLLVLEWSRKSDAGLRAELQKYAELTPELATDPLPRLLHDISKWIR